MKEIEEKVNRRLALAALSAEAEQLVRTLLTENMRYWK
jgi:hypothetical protein